MSRWLLVSAGASFSTKDVENGYRDALKRQGVEIIEYALDQRIERSASYYDYLWRKAKKAFDRPTAADILYLAGQGVLEKALAFEVDFVFVISGMYLHPNNFVLLRRAGLRTGVLFTESPYDDEQQAKVAPWVDVCWTNERSSLPYLRQFNENTHYLPHAYDPSRHAPVFEEQELLHDVVFVGTGFSERIEVLGAVDWDGINFGLYGTWGLLAPRSKLRRHWRDEVIPNERTIDLYRRSKIGLNLHRTSKGYGRKTPRITAASSLNPRAYELAASGLFQISDYRQEVDEVFGGSVPVFHSPTNLGRMIRLYLQDDAARHRSAYQACEAINGNTFDARAQQVLAEIQESVSIWRDEGRSSRTTVGLSNGDLVTIGGQ